jgi:hypothetical protein
MEMNSRFHDAVVSTHEKTTDDIQVVGGNAVVQATVNWFTEQFRFMKERGGGRERERERER